jgi:alkylation response protein AidB-like acyl-CoA dehydrogenase
MPAPAQPVPARPAFGTEPADGSPRERLDRLAALVPSLRAEAVSSEQARTLPYAAIEAIRETGVLSVRVPLEFGGAGGTVRDVIEAVHLIAGANSNIAQALRAHFGFTERLFSNRADDDQRKRWYPEVAAGTIFGNAISENVRRTSHEIGTVLSRDGGAWRLDGRKFYSTGSLYADIIDVLAVTEDGNEIYAFVDADAPGVALFDDWDGFGQQLTASGSTTFDAVAVSADRLSPVIGADAGLSHNSAFLQLYLATVVAGIAENIRHDAIEYVRNRARPAPHAVTETAAEDPYVLAAIGEISSVARTARTLVLAAADEFDAFHAADATHDPDAIAGLAVAVAETQLAINPAVIAAAGRLFDTGGASAASKSLGLDRHWRNARTIASHNPTAYKARAAGDWAVNGTPPPNSGYF